MSTTRKIQRQIQRNTDANELEGRKRDAESAARLQFHCPKCHGNTFRVLIGMATLDVLCMSCFVRTPLAQVNKSKATKPRPIPDLPEGKDSHIALP